MTGEIMEFVEHCVKQYDLAGAVLEVGSFDVCGNPFSDSLGTAGVASDGDITSAATFDQWFRDVLGVNVSFLHQIRLVDQFGTGNYIFDDTAFFPADGIAFGNEGDLNNNYFTYMIRASFVYDACTGQYLAFEGDDDFWLFVDDNLALDIGGVRPGTEQVVDMDRLGLTDGSTYFATLFYAQRLAGQATFSLRTNIDLMTDTFTTFSLQVD